MKSCSFYAFIFVTCFFHAMSAPSQRNFDAESKPAHQQHVNEDDKGGLHLPTNHYENLPDRQLSELLKLELELFLKQREDQLENGRPYLSNEKERLGKSIRHKQEHQKQAEQQKEEHEQHKEEQEKLLKEKREQILEQWKQTVGLQHISTFQQIKNQMQKTQATQELQELQEILERHQHTGKEKQHGDLIEQLLDPLGGHNNGKTEPAWRKIFLWQYVEQLAKEQQITKTLEWAALDGKHEEQNGGSGSGNESVSHMIIDGEPAERCSWPWMVALTTKDGLFVCAGSLVDRQYVLTAAHCVNYYFEEVGGLYAQFGVHNLTEDTPLQTIKVVNITLHNQYNPNEHGYYDIALLKLAEPAATDKHPDCIQTIQPASPNATAYPRPRPMPHSSNSSFRTNCLIVGWGLTEPGASTVSDVLMQKPVEIISNPRCSAAWDLSIFSSSEIYPENICIKSEEFLGSTSCQGDSGGPLQCFYEGQGWILEGVSSWGSAACKYYPSVYTRVSRFFVWMQAERIAMAL